MWSSLIILKLEDLSPLIEIPINLICRLKRFDLLKHIKKYQQTKYTQNLNVKDLPILPFVP